ncbi:MAG: peptidase M18 [Dethiosulfovibrio peptidovorans]|nr:MAG: peptidase M18 [Dethiosulfovibrio peptidovorans]
MAQKKTHAKRNGWNHYTPEDAQPSVRFLMKTVSQNKTEREWIRWLRSDLARRGAVQTGTEKLAPGDRVYLDWKGRAFLAAVIGTNGLDSGVTVIASHVDSPRVDIKGRPLYEEGNLAFLDCHYYGGLKKYQWTNIPLALHGEIHGTDGSTRPVILGEEPSDPVLTIPDLEPHVDRDMASRKASETVIGEDLDALTGHRPLGNEKHAVKAGILKLLQENWSMAEKDFLAADLALVPAGPARFAGFDRSMVAAYGLDDRVCTAMSYKAFTDMDMPKRTALFMAVDREEIGSESVGSAQGAFLDLFLLELLQGLGKSSDILSLKRLYSRSCAISADVTAGMNPLYPKNYVRDQQALLGNGIGMVKFSGHGGKYDGNEARGEFVASVVATLDRASVPWQTGSFGRVDKAGGGTIAKYLSRTGMDTVDIGPPLLSMHAPLELVSIVDIEATYQAYRALWTDLPMI